MFYFAFIIRSTLTTGMMESQTIKTMWNTVLNFMLMTGIRMAHGMIIIVEHKIAGFVRSLQVKYGYITELLVIKVVITFLTILSTFYGAHQQNIFTVVQHYKSNTVNDSFPGVSPKPSPPPATPGECILYQHTAKSILT